LIAKADNWQESASIWRFDLTAKTMAVMALRGLWAAFNEDSQPVKIPQGFMVKAGVLMVTRNRRFGFSLPETKTGNRFKK
jgi:hypothetical protein